MAFRIRGQGATEYLVLLAVVLIIALVSVALLGFFPGLSTDAKITQSASYWKSARPFAILESDLVASGNGTIIMQNMDASGTVTLNNITLVAANGTTTNTLNLGLTFGPGEIKNISGVNVTSGASGGVYDLKVTLNYTSANGVNTAQFGGKTLTGKYV